jgi:hypothetical protein
MDRTVVDPGFARRRFIFAPGDESPGLTLLGEYEGPAHPSGRGSQVPIRPPERRSNRGGSLRWIGSGESDRRSGPFASAATAPRNGAVVDGVLSWPALTLSLRFQKPLRSAEQ